MVEPDEITRQLIDAVVAAEPDLAIVGQAETGAEGLAMIVALGPDVAIVAVHLPDISGVEVIGQLHGLVEGPKLVAYTTDDRALGPAISAGAETAVLKDGRPEDLIAAFANLSHLMAISGVTTHFA